ncbi:hypothetical protein EDB89DRAFT_955357 [Lactarius sanguifluus]|nr:hypothetical protein EDB89DRAFT_955357 [Lactarius sanguifluus]
MNAHRVWGCVGLGLLRPHAEAAKEAAAWATVAADKATSRVATSPPSHPTTTTLSAHFILICVLFTPESSLLSLFSLID